VLLLFFYSCTLGGVDIATSGVDIAQVKIYHNATTSWKQYYQYEIGVSSSGLPAAKGPQTRGLLSSLGNMALSLRFEHIGPSMMLNYSRQ
jgi:hypothetical protein